MPNYISGVFNYCNAWCKRCPFENQCRSAEMSRKFEGGDRTDTHPPAAFPYVSGSFNDYWFRLDRILRTAGTSLQQEGYGLDVQNPEPVEITKNEAKKMAMHVTLTVADESGTTLAPWLNQPVDFDTPLGQACATFVWHGMMVGPKIGRMIGKEESSFRSFIRRDHDKLPTAKLNLIILTRSIAAATVIMEAAPNTIENLLPIVTDLAILLNYVRTRFPKAAKAVRPGFDNPAYTEKIEQFYNGFLPIDPIADNSWVIGERAPAE